MCKNLPLPPPQSGILVGRKEVCVCGSFSWVSSGYYFPAQHGVDIYRGSRLVAARAGAGREPDVFAVSIQAGLVLRLAAGVVVVHRCPHPHSCSVSIRLTSASW